MSDLEEILISLYASAINVSISWIWDGDIDVKLGDPLSGYKAEGKAGHLGGVGLAGIRHLTRTVRPLRHLSPGSIREGGMSPNRSSRGNATEQKIPL